MNEKLKKVIIETTPKRNVLKNMIKAFLIGGLICAIAEIINFGILYFFDIEKDIAMQNRAASQQDVILDVLPEMGDVSDSGSSSGSTFINDSEDESTGFSSSSFSSNDESDIKDASLMAKAISSILSDET